MPNHTKHGMHPRNIFVQPPDYTALAIKYKDFRKVCKLELNGKVSVDYKNAEVLCVLTQTLLLEYFKLSVEFAPGSLVPTLPLRLNYILWLEDLLATEKETEVHGIDIGSGSSCIYSLLAAKKNLWHMHALESNSNNVEYAEKNVKKNDLAQYITIYPQADKSVIFKDYFNSPASGTRTFHFCLCNPPFYDATLPDPFNSNTRNPDKRAPPHNARTGHAEELACEGGEVQFVQNIITESELYQERVRIYTTMLGHKQSLSKLMSILKARGITNVCTTLFCQGNTTRWGLAWSFYNESILKL